MLCESQTKQACIRLPVVPFWIVVRARKVAERRYTGENERRRGGERRDQKGTASSLSVHRST